MRLRAILNSNENCVEIVQLLLSLVEVKVTRTALEKALFNHPEYPSLLSVQDILTSYGVENLSFVTTVDNLSKSPLPLIASVRGEHSHQQYFTVVRSVTATELDFYDPEKHEWRTIGKEAFQKMWPSGVVMIVDAENGIPEKDYVRKRRKEQLAQAGRYVAYLALPVLVLLNALLAVFHQGMAALYPALFSMFASLGYLVCCLLVLYELDEHSPAVAQFCGMGKKVNCGAVLNSDASKILGVSWSAIGFSYFGGDLFMLLLGSGRGGLFSGVLGWVGVLALPYVFFSIYYQWRVAKQWCTLCLSVVTLLILQLGAILAGGWLQAFSFTDLTVSSNLMVVVVAYLTPSVLISLLLPAWKATKENKLNKAELQRVKNNADIFDALLHRQSAIKGETDQLGIVIGNPNATHKIVKVCNPYCGPCARAHTTIESLCHDNPDIQVQIIFTTDGRENDIKTPPVKHLLAIAGGGNEEKTRTALHDWYSAEEKNYELFAAKYPLQAEMEGLDGRLSEMGAWCSNNKIQFTPTFFVNGYQLPSNYTVEDLRYLLLD